MNPFSYARAASADDAIRQAALAGSRYLGGGTNLVDLMRETVEAPSALIDVSRLAPDIADLPDGGLRIGAGARNSAVAAHPRVRAQYPVLARALLAGASAQIRNMATVGGNILQRTRCTYFYDAEGARCNKRRPGQGCDAIDGFHREHAILGASPACAAVHPSDMCVALAVLDAQVQLTGPQGARRIPFVDVHRLPGDRPDQDTTLRPGELITAVELPPPHTGERFAYRKVRDRSSFAFALVSVAAVLRLENGRVDDVRLALGGVAHIPWRARKAEAALRGGPADASAFARAADAELADAQPLRDNGFKVELARRTLVAVLDALAKDAS